MPIPCKFHRQSVQQPSKVVKVSLFFLAVLFTLGPTLSASYLLVYEKDGEEHLVEGIEDSKPYYYENPEDPSKRLRRFLSEAGELKVQPGTDVKPSDLVYPLYYTIEKLAPVPESAHREPHYRIELGIRKYRVQQKPFFNPVKLAALWSLEELEEVILVLFWISGDSLEFLDLALNHNRGQTVGQLADLKARWKRNQDALDRILVSKCAQGQNRIVRFLVSRGAKANRVRVGTTALIAAMPYADEEILNTLLKAKADVNLTDKKGVSALISASTWGNKTAVDWLLEQGADPNHTTENGTSAISAATTYHHSGIVRKLLDHGADPNLADRRGLTPLETATLHGNRSIVQELIGAGAKCDLNEEKALMLMDHAFRNNIPEFVEIALSVCLDRSFKFHNRFPPHWVAKHYESEETLNLLLNDARYVAEAEYLEPTVTRASELEESPRLAKSFRPKYPRYLSERLGAQTAMVQFLISEDGSTLFPKIVSGSVPALNKIAIETVRRWKFHPPVADGQPVLTEAQVPLEFIPADPRSIVMELNEVDQAPVRISAVAPLYPRHLKRAGVQGFVRLSIIIDTDGNVRETKPVSSTHPDFAEAAVTAILKWKFKPAYKDGLPVKVRRIQPITFNL